jgi:hypothetical protein
MFTIVAACYHLGEELQERDKLRGLPVVHIGELL